MEHNFVNSGCISLIVSYLGRYDVGLPEYEINLRNIHVFLPREVMGPGTLFPPLSSHSMSWRANMGHIFYVEHTKIYSRYIWRYHEILEGVQSL